LLSVDDFAPEELARTSSGTGSPTVPVTDTTPAPQVPKMKAMSRTKKTTAKKNSGKKSAKRAAAKKSSRKKVAAKEKAAKNK